MYTCAVNNDVYNVYRFSCWFYGITVSISVRAVGAIHVHVDKDNFMARFHLANVRKSNHLVPLTLLLGLNHFLPFNAHSSLLCVGTSKAQCKMNVRVIS